MKRYYKATNVSEIDGDILTFLSSLSLPSDSHKTVQRKTQIDPNERIDVTIS